MAQQSAGIGFHYPSDIRAALASWREKFADKLRGSSDFDVAIMHLADRDRALEDHFTAALPTFDQVLTEEGTTSTSFTDLATVGPSVTAKLPRGRCVVTVGAYVTATVTNQTAVVGLYVDGGYFSDMVLLGNNAGGGGVGASLSATFLFGEAEGLTPGTHTFELKYLQSLAGPDEGRFAGRFLLVQPVA
jgi:hypothetical protein